MSEKRGAKEALRDFGRNRVSTKELLASYIKVRCPTAKCGCSIALACPCCVHGKLESDSFQPFVVTCDRCGYVTHGITCPGCRFFIKSSYLTQKGKEVKEMRLEEAKAERLSLVMLVFGVVVFFVVFSML